ncbi:manganese efflux pump [Lacrimispora sp. JR3]|uniref:manganese efflux pump n=1 Tax=Lacrimispora sinapis TaxID=3111456 RepID=UPI0037485972
MRDIFILVLALSTDSFVASVAYGANRLRISPAKVIAVNLICSGCLGAALMFGNVLHGLVPETFAKGLGFACLFFLGVMKLSDYFIKKYINHHVNVRKDLTFSISGLSIIINIYGNPIAADWDESKSLSWKETVMFSLAMSIDSLVAGGLSGFLLISPGMAAFISLLVGISVMYLGLYLGHELAARKNWDLSWVSGILFLFLAFGKL